MNLKTSDVNFRKIHLTLQNWEFLEPWKADHVMELPPTTQNFPATNQDYEPVLVGESL